MDIIYKLWYQEGPSSKTNGNKRPKELGFVYLSLFFQFIFGSLGFLFLISFLDGCSFTQCIIVLVSTYL